MKKYLLALLSLVAMLALLTACGGETQPADTEDGDADVAEVTGPVLADGVFTTETFTLQVPEGWVMDSNADEDQVALLKCESEDEHDVFSQPSLLIEVGYMVYRDREGTGSLDKLVENDKQFFENGTPAIADFTMGDYVGFKLSGSSPFYKGCLNDYYDLDWWAEGTDLCSRMVIKASYFTGEEQAEIQGMLDSLKVLVTAPESEEGATGGDVVATDGFTLTVPAGWVIDKQSAATTTLKNTKFDSGYVEVSCYTKSNDAATEAEKYNGNFGGDNEIWTREYNGITYYGITPSDAMEIMVADCGDGITLHIKTMFLTLDQVPEIMDGIVLKDAAES
ncbi:MAG: hypothetical protein HUJ67_05410 [Ruminiclostridium sp.]|nr:hypothetical protein [Ruminiclostridium sp.]